MNSKNEYSVHVLDLEKNAYVFASDSMQFTPYWARFTPNGNQFFMYVNPGFDPAWKEAIGKPGIIAFDAANWKFAGRVADFVSSEQNFRLFSMFSDESKFVFGDSIFDLKSRKWKSLDRDFRSHCALVVTRDDSKILGGYHNRIRLYDLEDEELTYPCILDNEYVNDIALTTDEKLFATACHDKTVRIWTFPKGELVATLPHTDSVKRVAWTPDGKNLVSGDEKGQLWFWTVRE